MRCSRILILVLLLTLSVSGCATLKPHDQPMHRYTGEPEIQEGMRSIPVDFLGNVFGSIGKLALWNHKYKSHRISDETKAAVTRELEEHPEVGNLRVVMNRWAPWESFKRLSDNEGVDWRWRWSFGLMKVLLFETILPNRIFGSDNYDPYTHSIYLYSDIPSLAKLQVHKASFYADRRFRGSLGASRIFLIPDWQQETWATTSYLKEIRDEQRFATEQEAFLVLHPHVANYPGPLFMGIGNIVGAMIGHVSGRYEVQRSRELEGHPLIEAGPFLTEPTEYL